jgi:carbamate kinase
VSAKKTAASKAGAAKPSGTKPAKKAVSSPAAARAAAKKAAPATTIPAATDENLAPVATQKAHRPLAVVAFGGNALLRPEDDGTVAEQLRRSEGAAVWLADFARRGYDLVCVHGNGPQVGQVLIQMEEAAAKVPPGTVDFAVAETEGGMGYLLELAIRNRLASQHIKRQLATVLTLVTVNRDDPAFRAPSKPIGPFFARHRAIELQRRLRWKMVEDSGRGWRKVVPSPRPLEIVNLTAVRSLLDHGHLVIAGGGGGIPVVRKGSGRLVGVEAVIDKDRTSALLARDLKADLFILLTGVPQVVKNFGRKDQEPLLVLPLSEARHLLDKGQFPAGSMGPKIEAAIDFVAATGRPALITNIEHLEAALEGESGTRIVP